jgi:RNA polymerase sigma-70 factor (ECF subfamily)
MSKRDNQHDWTRFSDEELLARYRAGFTAAFAELVRRYERELYNYLRRYLGDATLAEDVFQNTFLQLHLKLDLYEKGRLVRPWLYTIATHQAIDAMRKAGRHQAVSLDARAPGQNDTNSFVDLLEGSETDPLEGLEAVERQQWVRSALDQLPVYLRSVVVMAYYQGLKYREIAEVLDIPVGTVKSRLHAAVARLTATWKSSQPIVEK